MIIRRATLVVAGTTMSRSATPWRPRALARGAPRSGDRAAVGAENEVICCLGARIPLRGRTFLWKALLGPRGRARFHRTGWDEALRRRVCLALQLQPAPPSGNAPRRHPASPESLMLRSGHRRRYLLAADLIPGIFCISARTRCNWARSAIFRVNCRDAVSSRLLVRVAVTSIFSRASTLEISRSSPCLSSASISISTG